MQFASRYVVNALFAPNIIILRVYDLVSFYIDQIWYNRTDSLWTENLPH